MLNYVQPFRLVWGKAHLRYSCRILTSHCHIMAYVSHGEAETEKYIHKMAMDPPFAMDN